MLGTDISDNCLRYLQLKHNKDVKGKDIFLYLSERSTIVGIMGETVSELVSIGIKPKVAISILDANYDKKSYELELDSLYKLKEKMPTTILCIEDDLYPEMLKTIPNPPPVIYVIGNAASLNTPSIAIVGSRKASQVGLNKSFEISYGLGKSGITIVSGLAYGIDIEANKGAIEANGRTVAVLGSGLNHIYPDKHIKYIKDIIGNGCLITEYSFDVMPLAKNFPIRNRIISGLSYGVVVVEAAPKSGSLVTARYGLEQNRNIYACPAGLDSYNSSSNQLIKDGAKLTENYMDIIEDLTMIVGYETSKEDISNKVGLASFSDNIKTEIYDIIKLGSIKADEISIKLGYDMVNILRLLTELELEEYISKDSFGKYNLIK